MSILLLSIACCLFIFYVGLFVKSLNIRSWPTINTDYTVDLSSQVSVVIAARNEEKNIQNCINSILLNKSVKQIIIVDDHSSDATLNIVQKFATSFPKIKAYQAPLIPDGWTGKNFALDFGSQKVDSEYILFTDADVILLEGIVDRALSVMASKRLEHLSGSFYIQCLSVGENICAPVLALSSTAALFSKKNIGAATGAFNMVKTDFYKKNGGHPAIKSSIIDDVALARLIKKAGGKSIFLNFQDNVKVRLFCGFEGFISLVTRTAQAYLGNSIIFPIAGGFFVLSVGLATVVVPLAAMIFIFIYAFNSIIAVAGLISLAGYLTGLKTIFMYQQFHNGRIIYIFLYPLAIMLLGISTIKSSLKKIFNSNILWKDRQYPVFQTQQLKMRAE